MVRLSSLIAAILLLAFSAHSASLGEDGLYQEPWITNTFMDLREDLEEANENQQRLLILFEQKGCGYCKRMHEKVYSVPEISRKLQEDFFVIRINIFGDLEVTDFDGQTLPEKQIVQKWGVMFTPTMMFFPKKISESITAPQAAVVTMPGAFAKEQQIFFSIGFYWKAIMAMNIYRNSLQEILILTRLATGRVRL